MATLDDILTRRAAAIAILLQKLEQAIELKNRGAQGMDDTINALAKQRDALALEVYTGGLDDPSMAQALAALDMATAEMHIVAARMVSATSFRSNLAGLVAATSKAVSALTA